MTEGRSLGQLYQRTPAPASQHDLPGSIGDLYSGWIEQDAGNRGRLGDQWDRATEHAAPATDSRPEVSSWSLPGTGDKTTVAPQRPRRPGSADPLGAPAEPAATGAADATATSGGSAAPAGGPAASPKGLGRSSLLMASGTLVSRLLGFLRGALQATALGVSTEAANVWSTANTLPNIIYLLLAGGVINAVLVPQITKSLRHEDGGKGYTDRLLTLAFCIIGGLTVLCLLAAPLLYRLYDLNATGSRAELGWSFAVICLPQIFFYGMYALLGQVLNARSRFGAFMWAPALANVVAIAGLVYFLLAFPRRAPISEWDGSMIAVLAGSATLGIVVQAACLIPVLARDGYRFTPNFHWRGVGLRSTSTIALWAFAAVLLQQLGLIITTNVLNTQPAGQPGKTAQELGFLLFMLPHSLITVSLVTALFTRMSSAANQRKHDEVRHDFREGMRLIGVATIPCTVASFALGGTFISLVYGADTVWTIGSFMWPMMLGLTAYGLCVMVQRVFYAYEDARTPFRMQLFCTGVAAVMTLGCLLLPDRYMGLGIGLSLTVSNLVQGVIGLRWLSGTVGAIQTKDVVQTYVRLLTASVCAGLPALIVAVGLGRVVPSRLGDALGLILGGLLFVALFVLLSRRLRIADVERIVAPLSRRLRRVVAR